MSRYRFELATPADDAALRAVLAATPMPGAISVRFAREPSYFGAAVVDGRFRQIGVVRDQATGRVVGFGSRSVMLRYVNGRPAPIGYVSHLRLLPEHRGGTVVARGYRFFRQLHDDGRAALYLTTIIEDNRLALAVLTSGRAGLPAYHFAGRFHTAALALTRRWRAGMPPRGVEVRPASGADLPAVLEFLRQMGPRRQFFPCYEVRDITAADGMLRDLRPEDLLLAFRAGRLVGTLAGWNQERYRQHLIHGYGPPLNWLRPLYNGWAHLTGRPRLPRPGMPLRCLLGALPLVADDDPDVFRALVMELLVRRAGGQWNYLMLGLHESDPLLAGLRDLPARWYVANLYHVCWDDGEALRRGLDGRPAYLELGSL